MQDPCEARPCHHPHKPAPAPLGALASPKAELCNPGLRPSGFGAPSTARTAASLHARPWHQPRHRLLSGVTHGHKSEDKTQGQREREGLTFVLLLLHED